MGKPFLCQPLVQRFSSCRFVFGQAIENTHRRPLGIGGRFSFEQRAAAGLISPVVRGRCARPAKHNRLIGLRAGIKAIGFDGRCQCSPAARRPAETLIQPVHDGGQQGGVVQRQIGQFQLVQGIFTKWLGIGNRGPQLGMVDGQIAPAPVLGALASLGRRGAMQDCRSGGRRKCVLHCRWLCCQRVVNVALAGQRCGLRCRRAVAQAVENGDADEECQRTNRAPEHRRAPASARDHEAPDEEERHQRQQHQQQHTHPCRSPGHGPTSEWTYRKSNTLKIQLVEIEA